MIERFHRDAPQDRAGQGAANMGAVLDINEAGFATSELPPAPVADPSEGPPWTSTPCSISSFHIGTKVRSADRVHENKTARTTTTQMEAEPRRLGC
jgi:hypothetical protein